MTVPELIFSPTARSSSPCLQPNREDDSECFWLIRVLLGVQEQKSNVRVLQPLGRHAQDTDLTGTVRTKVGLHSHNAYIQNISKTNTHIPCM